MNRTDGEQDRYPPPLKISVGINSG